MFQGQQSKTNIKYNKTPKYNKTALWLILPLGLLASATVAYNKQTPASLESEFSGDNTSDKIRFRKVVSKSISDKISHNIFPTEISLTDTNLRTVASEKSPKYRINYTMQADLQNRASSLLKRYKPDYAAIVMMDAKTGEILAMSSFQKTKPTGTNLAIKATYPAASIFKVITAATAVDKTGISPNHRIAFNGGNHTLYKKNVLSERINRWTRFISLKDAFARSINTAFGRLSLESMEPQDLSDYANKFYFNQEIPSDFNVESSVASVPAEKGFALTEVASGYNRFNTLSPVHAAMIASTIVNDGQMPSPYIVKSIKNENDETIYTGEALNQGQVITAQSAEKVRQMMEQTVLTGTSRKTFKRLVRDRKFKEVEMGGKTGHMTGTSPKGRTDWFVGYASDDESRIAIATITVNVKKWTVKSSALGEMMFREYFKNKINAREAALNESLGVEPRTRKTSKLKKRG
ncbi:MAG: penicillin-binding transpeptidase domain-containing protein [Bdellovibrionota bacterium]